MGAVVPAGAAPFSTNAARGLDTPRKGIVPPRNPVKNLAPTPNFYASCAPGALDQTVLCNSKVVQAIDHARGTEPVGALRFDLQKFLRLSVPDQLFAIADMERVTRGEPPMTALTTQLERVAKAGAVAGRDPELTSPMLSGGADLRAWGSNFADGTESSLGADYGWMYDDGYGGFNYDCPTAHAQGCWGHRDNVLGRWSADLGGCPAADSRLVMGAAYARSKYGATFAEIFVAACGPTPAGEVFTWAEAQAAIGI